MRASIYIIALAFLGAGVGIVVALSKSSISGILLPLLFTLIAGSSGLIVSKQDLSQKAGRTHIAFVGLCIISFTIGLLGGGTGGMLLKRSHPTPVMTDIDGFAGLDPESQLKLAELRTLAILIGTSSKERETILKQALLKNEDSEEKKESLKENAKNLATLIENIIVPSPTNESDDESPEWRSRIRYLHSAGYFLKSWSDDPDYSSENIRLVNQYIETINYISNQMFDDNAVESDLEDLVNSDEALFSSITKLNLYVRANSSIGVPPNLYALDQNKSRIARIELLKLMAGAPSVSHRDVNPFLANNSNPTPWELRDTSGSF